MNFSHCQDAFSIFICATSGSRKRVWARPFLHNVTSGHMEVVQAPFALAIAGNSFNRAWFISKAWSWNCSYSNRVTSVKSNRRIAVNCTTWPDQIFFPPSQIKMSGNARLVCTQTYFQQRIIYCPDFYNIWTLDCTMESQLFKATQILISAFLVISPIRLIFKAKV